MIGPGPEERKRSVPVRLTGKESHSYSIAMAINLSPEDLRSVKETLKRRFPAVRAMAFGSRTRQSCKDFADLDILLFTGQGADPADIGLLKDDFSESDLPFRVDIVEESACSPAFIRSIEKDFVPLTE
jgi:predicted nucleotidyltransferase